MESVGSLWHWLAFLAVVLVMLALDLGVFHRKAHKVTVKEAGVWSLVWVTLSMGFAGLVWVWFGQDRALEFTTGYLLEKSLAVDNIFVFVLIFATFKVPEIYQHRVLFWGILGALVMRAGFVAGGAALISNFHWVIYVFGGFLALSGIKMLLAKEGAHDLEGSRALRWFRRIIPTTKELHGDRFVVRVNGRRMATPLLLALIAVEISDLIFAVDSVPAIFAVTQDPFIVFTSNIFAILGLRSMYFLLAGVLDRFHYLKVGLSFVLVFIGVKMLLLDVYKIPTPVSLGAVAGILIGSVVLSLLKTRKAAGLAAATD